jgi:hypothetical protein
LRATGYFEPAAIERLITEVRAGRGFDARILLMVLGVELRDALFRRRVASPQPVTARPSAPGGAGPAGR